MEEENKVTNGTNDRDLAEEQGNSLIKEPRRWILFAVAVPVVALFLGGWFVVTAFFGAYADKLEKDSIANYGYSPQKLEQMAYETNKLYTFGYEDVATGRLRVPIDKAIDMALSRYENLQRGATDTRK